jgi:hypothetical protein
MVEQSIQPQKQARTQCKGITKIGKPCGWVTWSGSPDFCLTHDPGPAAEAKRAEARHLGGKGRKAITLPPELRPPSLKTKSRVMELIAETIHQVRTGQVDTKVATAVGYLTNILLRSFEVGDSTHPLTVVFHIPPATNTDDPGDVL